MTLVETQATGLHSTESSSDDMVRSMVSAKQLEEEVEEDEEAVEVDEEEDEERDEEGHATEGTSLVLVVLASSSL